MNAPMRTYGPRPPARHGLRAPWFSTKSFDFGLEQSEQAGFRVAGAAAAGHAGAGHCPARHDGGDIVVGTAAAGAQKRQRRVVAVQAGPWWRPKPCRWCCRVWSWSKPAACWFSDRRPEYSTSPSATATAPDRRRSCWQYPSCRRKCRPSVPSRKSGCVVVELLLVVLARRAAGGRRAQARPRRCPAAPGHRNRWARKSGRSSGRH